MPSFDAAHAGMSAGCVLRQKCSCSGEIGNVNRQVAPVTERAECEVIFLDCGPRFLGRGPPKRHRPHLFRRRIAGHVAMIRPGLPPMPTRCQIGICFQRRTGGALDLCSEHRLPPTFEEDLASASTAMRAGRSPRHPPRP